MAKKSSVIVDGEKLYTDRKRLGLSVQALVDKSKESPLNMHVSKSTIDRAERGLAIRQSSLKAIARLLNEPHEKYIYSSELQVGSEANLSGAWEGFFIEPDINLRPSIVEIKMVFNQQNGLTSEMDALIRRADEESTEKAVETQLIDDLVLVKSYIVGWKQPSGISSTMMKLSRGDDLLDGYTTWLDLDSQDIEVSKIILARKSSRYFEKYWRMAEATFQDILRGMLPT